MRLEAVVMALMYPVRWLRAAWRVGPAHAAWVVSYDSAWRASEAKR